MNAEFAARGWARFPFDPALDLWAAHANGEAERLEATPPEGQLRCDGTWFVGVNALPNDVAGRLPGGPPLAGLAIDAARRILGGAAFDRAQASVCYAGYPRRGADESPAAHTYRRDRDAAHVDGLLPIGPERRRHWREAHAFILGLPLNDPPEGGAPFVIWEGSHLLMAEMFAEVFAGHPPERWPEIDLTDAYHAARRSCFATCRRIELPARRGEAYFAHRFALHGVAPWRGGAGRRAAAYFRPDPHPGGDFKWALEAA